MSIFDQQRIHPENFKIDAERMRSGWYSDKYFENITGMLGDLARRGYRFGGYSTRMAARRQGPGAARTMHGLFRRRWAIREYLRVT